MFNLLALVVSKKVTKFRYISILIVWICISRAFPGFSNIFGEFHIYYFWKPCHLDTSQTLDLFLSKEPKIASNNRCNDIRNDEDFCK